MKTRTSSQNKRLHQLLNELRIKGEKETLVAAHTQGRTTSSREMYDYEAAQLISTLTVEKMKRDGKLLPASQVPEPKEKTPNEWVKAQKMRRKMCSLAHTILWKDHLGKADIKRINNWCIKNGKYKKALNEHSYKELIQLVSQFETMVKRILTQTEDGEETQYTEETQPDM